MNCEYCKEQRNIIYDDGLILGFLDSNPYTKGHIVLIPKQHYTIMEQVPDEVIGNLFVVANKISAILFDVLKVNGTNVLINNGIDQEIPHMSLNIIPRDEKDNLNLSWEPKKADEDDLDVVLHNLKNALIEKKSVEIDKKPVKIQSSSWIDKTFNRIP